MYDDHDLVSRAMQPHQRLLQQARDERLIRQLRSQQRRSKTAFHWMAALGDRLVLAGQFLRIAAPPREANRPIQGRYGERSPRRAV